MNKIDLLPDKQYFFGALFVVSNRLDTILEREFNRYGVITKQWFLSIVLLILLCRGIGIFKPDFL